MIHAKAVVTAAALLLTATVAVAATPDFPVRPSTLNSTESGLWLAVEQAEKAMQTSPLLVRDEALNAYVRRIVCQLAGPGCSEIRVYILDFPNFNAAAYPNGALQVWTGLLLRVENEAQLAYVLGHELTHFQKRHSLKQFESVRDTSGALAAFSIVTAGVTGGLAGLAADTIAVGGLYSYSRGQESEADDGGFDLAVAQGYDPHQAAIIWKYIDEEEKSNPRRDHPSPFLANHPSNAARLAAMTKRADEIATRVSATKLGTEEFRAVTLPHRAHWLDEELNRGVLDESLTVIERLRKSEPDSVELEYFKAEALRRRNGKGDLANALSAYRDVAGKPGVPPQAFRGLGLAALKSGDKSAAHAAFQNYLDAVPDADDRDTIKYYLTSTGE